MKPVVFLALVGLLACASAARVPSDYIIRDDVFSGGLSGIESVQHLIASRGKGKEGKEKAQVLFRYIVPTDKKDEFVERWRELEKATAEEEDNIIVDLKKTIYDNFIFTAYAEWKHREAFLDHLESDHVQDWLKWTLDNNIVMQFEPLLAPAKDTRVEEKHHGKEKHRLFHIVVKYTVPPEHIEDFVDAWQKVQKQTDKEDGIQIYSLRKPMHNNYQFYTYGTWESWEDFEDHFTSDYVEEFTDFLDEHEILWQLAPLKKIGSQPE